MSALNLERIKLELEVFDIDTDNESILDKCK